MQSLGRALYCAGSQDTSGNERDVIPPSRSPHHKHDRGNPASGTAASAVLGSGQELNREHLLPAVTPLTHRSRHSPFKFAGICTHTE